ncbi:MAG TPA: hypothetical protein DGX96_00760 [Lachnospiraceae bacterium]|nr:hypothetical protein [Lachnospiraceae bacterium]
MRETKQQNAYLTVFLSMILTIVLSLVLVLVDGARRNGVRQISEIVTDTGVSYVFSEYHRELMRRYDLFFIDTSYGTAGGGISRTTEHLKTCLETNLTPKGYGALTAGTLTGVGLSDARITGYRTIFDENGKALREQIAAYFTSEVMTGQAWNIANLSGRLQARGWDSESPDVYENYSKDVRKKLSEADTMGVPRDGYDDLDGDGIEDEADISAGNPFEALDRRLSQPVLVQIFGSESNLSAKSIQNPFSKRRVMGGTGARAENTHAYTPAGSMMMVLYLNEKCGDYRTPGTGALSYEKEYVLCGKSTDRQNLSAVCTRLLAVREAANLTYLLSSRKRMAQAKAAGALLSLIVLSPQLEPLFTAAAVVIWSYIESLTDVRTLMKGNRVPILKTDRTFQNGLASILQVDTWQGNTKGQDQGFTYEEYLNAFLYLQDLASPGTTNVRLLDLIEQNLRLTKGNGNFRIDNLVDVIEIACDFRGKGGITCSVYRSAGYD